MLKKEKLSNGKIKVTFRISECVWADHINLVGEFNNWDTQSHPLKQSSGDACWHISIDLEAHRAYRFRYLVDGKSWMNDDHADRYEGNAFGTSDSIVLI